VATLREAAPHLTTYVTLSPVPGFGRWLQARLALEARADRSFGGDFVAPLEQRALTAFRAAASKEGVSLDAPFAEDAPLPPGLRESLLRLCAVYLVHAKKRQSALDPVAAFHLRNGAILAALHWEANPSPKGRRESAGIMVNYLYEHSQIEPNHSAYVANGYVATTAVVQTLLADDIPSKL